MASSRTLKRKRQRGAKRAYYADLHWWRSLTPAQKLEANPSRYRFERDPMGEMQRVLNLYVDQVCVNIEASPILLERLRG